VDEAKMHLSGDGEKRMMERMSEVESRSLQGAWRVMSNGFKVI